MFQYSDLKKAYMEFFLDDCYLESVTIKKSWGMYDGKDSLTEEEFIKILQGKDRCSTIYSIDHPEFTKLREALGQLGLIKIERGWWNGDKVIKPFVLNSKTFRKNEQFPCASAMRGTLKYMK
jgi:hypothetical protein